MTFHDEINAFFHTYIDAFARRDADAISELWDDVRLFPTPGWNFAMDRRAIHAHCSTLLKFYSERRVPRVGVNHRVYRWIEARGTFDARIGHHQCVLFAIEHNHRDLYSGQRIGCQDRHRWRVLDHYQRGQCGIRKKSLKSSYAPWLQDRGFRSSRR